MNHSTYTHPSEGKPLIVRFLIATAAILFLLLICSAPREAEAQTSPHFSRPCRVVAGEADDHDGKLDRIAARHGGIDYVGRDYTGKIGGAKVGRWYLNDTGQVFGFSMEEDGRVYSTARCARIAPVYLNSPT